jgi:hypothetical protein
MAVIVLLVSVLRHALLGLLLAASAHADELQCLKKHYGAAVDPSLAVDGDPARSDEERLEHPTLRDMFRPRYRTGAIAPVTDPKQDPGRVRVEALFRAAWPDKALVDGKFFGHPVRVQPKVAAALAAVEKRLAGVKEALPFVRKLGGTYNARNIAGTDRQSAHAWGIAIDLDPDRSHYWRWSKSGWQNQVPQSVVDAFEAEGFIWGGRWYHFDTMHFEYRPELLDARCYE